MHYRHGLLFPTVPFRGVQIADARDIGLMKITAASIRGSKEDSVDLHVIAHQVFSLEGLFELFPVKHHGVDYCGADPA
ncbi:MAG: hypothetical protein VB144_01840 [Clostridia bacterium]|nr:hypothetical protein [Clostridia bacterium]